MEFPLELSTYAQWLWALMVWRESRGAEAAWPGVAWVALNRVAPGWSTHCGLVEVIRKPWQFSSMTAHGDANLILWPPDDQLEWVEIQQLVEMIAQGLAPDPTNGATFYYSPPLTEPPAAWGAVEPTVQLGTIRFFKSR